MRIGFDLDGVLADLHTTFAETALRLFPHLDIAAVAAPDTGSSPPVDEEAPDEPPLEEPDPSVLPPLGRRESNAVWKALVSVDNFWETLGEIESGAIRRLAAIADTEGWEVIFLTSRPFAPGRTVQRQSQTWLAKHGFPMPSVYVVQGSRGRIAESLQLDVFVDDRPDNCLDIVLESKARAILVWRGSPSKIPASTKRLGIGVVTTVAACLDLLVEAGRDKPGSTDLIPRLRRLLGLQPKPTAGR